MLFRELNRSKCKTYLIACENSHKAVLIDPIKEKIDRYLRGAGPPRRLSVSHTSRCA